MSTEVDPCACGPNAVGAGTPILVLNPDPSESIIVRAKEGITIGNTIVKLNENGKTIYELRDFILVKPIVAFTNNAPVMEIGDTLASVQYDGSIEQGSNVIVSRSITPNPGGLDLTAPFSFIINNVTRSTPGSAAGERWPPRRPCGP